MYIPFMIVIVASVLCLGLNRAVQTRTLGYGAAGAALLAGIALLVMWVSLPSLVELAALQPGLPDIPGLQLVLQPDDRGTTIGLVLLGGGALLLLALAGALSASLRGFGRLFGYVLLALAVDLAALYSANPFVVA